MGMDGFRKMAGPSPTRSLAFSARRHYYWERQRISQRKLGPELGPGLFTLTLATTLAHLHLLQRLAYIKV